MKPIQTLLLTGLALSAASSYAGLTIGSGDPSGFGDGSSIQFSSPGSFTFASDSFTVSSDTKVYSGALSGSWTFNTLGVVSGGTGSFTITDGSDSVTGNLTWKSIGVNPGKSVSLNASGLVNFTSISGSSSELLSLLGSSAAVNLSVDTHGQITSLAELAGASAKYTSFSGTITPVPEPSTYIAGISALGLFGLVGWKSRKN